MSTRLEYSVGMVTKQNNICCHLLVKPRDGIAKQIVSDINENTILNTRICQSYHGKTCCFSSCHVSGDWARFAEISPREFIRSCRVPVWLESEHTLETCIERRKVFPIEDNRYRVNDTIIAAELYMQVRVKIRDCFIGWRAIGIGFPDDTLEFRRVLHVHHQGQHIIQSSVQIIGGEFKNGSCAFTDCFLLVVPSNPKGSDKCCKRCCEYNRNKNTCNQELERNRSFPDSQVHDISLLDFL